MFYVPLHQKYRPQTFAQLVGQEAISTTLTNAIINQKIAPAYLFTGPRGTGKTSSARILAKSLNCLNSNAPTPDPCGQCEVCRMITLGAALDVIEIDAASNTGVDNIRELIEKAQFAPVQCRYKVYVIDECHMLSQAAFNALLKTLEEPPERVVFVLATTDPQRVLSTIISRCQKFDYRRIPLDSMVSHLINIAKKENIAIEKDAITLVAQIANGGLRDAQSLLDQLSLLSGTITVDKVWDLVGAVPEKDLLELIKEIRNNHSEGVISQCRHLMNRGREPLIVLQNLANFYLSLLIAKTAPDRSDLVAVTAPTWEQLCQEANQWQIFNILQGQKVLKESEFQLKNTTQPRLWLEVTLLSLLPSAQPSMVVTETPTNQGQNSVKPVAQNPSVINNIAPAKPQETIKNRVNETEQKQEKIEGTQEVVKTEETGGISQGEIWQNFLNYFQPQIVAKSLFGVHCFLMKVEENLVIIGVKNQGVLKHLQDKIPSAEITFEKIFNRKMRVKLELSNSETEKKTLDHNNSAPKPQNNNNLGYFPPDNVKNNIVNFSAPRQIQNQENLALIIEEKNKEEEAALPPIIPQLREAVTVEETNISESQLEQISMKLAEIFKGEVVENSQNPPWKFPELPEQENSEKLPPEVNLNKPIDSQKPDENSPSNNLFSSKIVITDRPDLSMYENEDDIPF